MSITTECIDNIEIYLNNTYQRRLGKGGYSAIIRTPSEEVTISGGATGTNSSAIEVHALDKALETIWPTLKEKAVLTVKTSQGFIVDALWRDLNKWKRNNWRKADGDLIDSLKEWKNISTRKALHEIKGEFQKAYKKSPMGKLTKRLAGEGLKRQTVSVTSAQTA